MKKLLLCTLILFNLKGLSISAQIKYVETSESEETIQAREEDDLESVNQNEGISSEQIIMQITKDGFVTSHGDHYHYYNGKPPYDSIFSNHLLAPKDYQFDEQDVISEIENGYIVEQDGKYYVYFADLNKVTSLRTKDEMSLQAQGIKPAIAKDIADLRTKYSLSDNAKISVDLEANVEDLTDKDVIVYLFENGFVTLKEQQLTVILKDLPTTFAIEKSLVVDKATDDNIIEELEAGTIVKTADGLKLMLKDKKNIRIVE